MQPVKRKVSDIVDGIIRHSNDGYGIIKILQELLITKYDDPIHAVVHSTFQYLYQ